MRASTHDEQTTRYQTDFFCRSLSKFGRVAGFENTPAPHHWLLVRCLSMGSAQAKVEKAFLVNGKQHRITIECTDYMNSFVYIDGRKLQNYYHDPAKKSQEEKGVPFEIDGVKFRIFPTFHPLRQCLTKMVVHQQGKPLFTWRTDKPDDVQVHGAIATMPGTAVTPSQNESNSTPAPKDEKKSARGSMVIVTAPRKQSFDVAGEDDLAM